MAGLRPFSLIRVLYMVSFYLDIFLLVYLKIKVLAMEWDFL